MESNNYNIKYIDIISDIRRATVDSQHPYRYAGLSTVNPTSGVTSRTVVLRQLINDDQLLIYTDSRTQKVKDITNDNRVSLLCYHHGKQRQVRLNGRATVMHEGLLYNQCLKKISTRAARDYNTDLPPGTIYHGDPQVTREEEIVHFGLISIIIEIMDYLIIGRPEHQRIRFEKSGEGWIGTTLIA